MAETLADKTAECLVLRRECRLALQSAALLAYLRGAPWESCLAGRRAEPMAM